MTTQSLAPASTNIRELLGDAQDLLEYTARGFTPLSLSCYEVESEGPVRMVKIGNTSASGCIDVSGVGVITAKISRLSALRVDGWMG